MTQLELKLANSSRVNSGSCRTT